MARTRRNEKPSAQQIEQWQDDRAAKIEEAKRMLIDGLGKLRTNEGFVSMLEKMAKHSRLSPARFSFRNQILVEMQMPGAQYVATFKGWQAVGRQVIKKDEWPTDARTITILRPSTFKKEYELEDGSKEEKTHMFFRSLSVFDISCTKGEELEPIQFPDVTGQEDFAHSVDKLREVAYSIPGNVVGNIDIRPRRKGDDKTARGWYEFGSRNIVIITTGRTRAQQFKTLCHELAHAILHGDNDHHTYPEREVEAESTAFVVCRALGLDTADASFNYVGVWATRSKEDAIKLIAESGTRISKASNMILDALLGKMGSNEMSEAA